MNNERKRPSAQDLEAEAGMILPAKEVLSVPLLDLNIDVDLALALAAPIDLAVAGNLNVALPIAGAVSANVLSIESASSAMAKQAMMIDHYISGEAVAQSDQVSSIDQTNDDFPDGTTTTAAPASAAPAVGATTAVHTAPAAAPMDGRRHGAAGRECSAAGRGCRCRPDRCRGQRRRREGRRHPRCDQQHARQREQHAWRR